MLTPAEAEAAIAAAVVPVSPETLPLAACAGRILRAPLRAERDAPPFDRVAMDGIAFASGAGARRLRIAGVHAAGRPAPTLASPQDCFEVMTGAVLPHGCDVVVPVEALRLEGGYAELAAGDGAPAPWRHVHRKGSDARAGDLLLAPGTRLRGPELAIAASAGSALLSVSRPPRIAIVSTGDELVEPGVPILDHQVRRSNAHGLSATLALAGFPPGTDLHLPDDVGALAAALAPALEAHDVLVLSGGVSAGRFDHVPAVLARLGVERRFHGIAQRPGRPMWFGTRAGGPLVFALPGNPVSVLVCLVRYVLPALQALVATGAPPPPRVALARDAAVDRPLTAFLPVALGYDEGGRTLAEPRPTRGSGDFGSLAGTDGFVELPPGPAIHRAGLDVTFHRW